MILIRPYDCTPPDSEEHLGAIGCFVLPGNYHDVAQVADSHSPTFIQDQKQHVTLKTMKQEGEHPAFSSQVQIDIPNQRCTLVDWVPSVTSVYTKDIFQYANPYPVYSKDIFQYANPCLNGPTTHQVTLLFLHSYKRKYLRS